MELPRRQDQSQSERKGQKRKLEEEIGEITTAHSGDDARKAILVQVAEQVKLLDSSFSWSEADRHAAKRATHVLAELAKNGESLSLSNLRSRPDFSFSVGFCEILSLTDLSVFVGRGRGERDR